ncbi:MAG: acyl-CoA dehydratase activase [Spirochaetota bacterium]|nr:acyl-CoA dehydratase activase [Spirochaetota bacterium]
MDTNTLPILGKNNHGHDHRVLYRFPYAFKKTDEERVQDALRNIEPLLLLEHNKRNNTTPTLPYSYTIDTISVCLRSTHSDLWVELSSLDDISNNPVLDTIDRVVQKCGQTIYRYYVKDEHLHAQVLKDKNWSSSLGVYVGLDAGSISINTAVVDEYGTILETDYTFTEGDIINNVKRSLANIHKKLPVNCKILGTGVTGSGHEIAGALLGADIYETELDAHAKAAVYMVPDVKVVFDIGGQDSKVMYIENGVLVDATMNKKCGAGTGAFLNAQAARLGIPIEKFGEVSLKAKKPYRFSSMCTVFVGRDLIAEQAKGNTKENIIAGLHRSLAMNFFSTLGINKKHLQTPIVFQGGVASNIGVKYALEECLREARNENIELIVPMFSNVMGAIGMALFARETVQGKTNFRGFEKINSIRSVFAECTHSSAVQCGKDNPCDLVSFYSGENCIQVLYSCPQYMSIASGNSVAISSSEPMEVA